MEEKISEIKEFLEHMAFEYGTSGMSVFDTKTWAEGVWDTFNEMINGIGFNECGRCLKFAKSATVTSYGEIVCAECWKDGQDKE